MNLITRKKAIKLAKIVAVREEYTVLMKEEGVLKTAVYEALARKHNTTSTTIRKYLMVGKKK